MSSPTIHSSLGASGAYRWMACPGSVSLSKDIPRKETEYSKEGTAAHALAETAILSRLSASNWLGERMEGVVVTAEMAEAVDTYVYFIRDLVQEGDILELEHKFSLESLKPPAPMFGTSDAIIYKAKEKKLIVADYKHGAGVPVEVTGNPQLRYYALGALLSFKHRPVDSVEIYIVQPRARHANGPIRSEVVSLAELMDFSVDLLAAAEEALRPNAELVAGKHCRFCPAQPMCPALHKEAQLVAADEFAGRPLVDPRLLSPEQLGAILDRADIIEDWLRSVRGHVQHELEAGRAVPGYKLVPKRASRVWVDERAVVKWASSKLLGDEELFDRKLKSPAALEKVVGKKDLPKELYASVSSGFTLAPSNDPRPAITSVASEEFSALPPS